MAFDLDGSMHLFLRIRNRYGGGIRSLPRSVKYRGRHHGQRQTLVRVRTCVIKFTLTFRLG